MIEIINAITDSLLKLSKIAAYLIPLLQTIAVIMALAIVGFMIWNGKQ